tara:strand:- start:276 stop:494 length:219 start_codon:yes stop_codon:yes gene_type:complete
MISQKDLKDYEFKAIENYFDYIIDTEINGNYSQLKELIKKLSQDQKKLLWDYLNDSTFNECVSVNNVKGYLI